MFDGILKHVARIQEKAPVLIILLALTATLFLGYYAFRIETDANFEVMFRDDSQFIILNKLVANEFGSTDLLYVIVQLDEDTSDTTALRDIRDPSVLKSVAALQRTIETEPAVSSTGSISDILISVYGRLPETLEESKQMISNLPMDTGSVVSNDFTAVNIIAYVNIGKQPGDIENTEKSIKEKLEDASVPTGVKASLTGMPTLMSRIMNLLIDDNVRTIGIALIGVFLLLWIYFRSAYIAGIAIVPVVMTLLWLGGTLTLLGIRLSFMIASVGAMMVGMGIDYSIHMTHAFHENIRKGKKNVTESTVKSVGGALIASAATTAAGFMAMMLGTTPNSTIQGKVLAMGIGFAFFTSIVVLPAMLIVQRKLIYSKMSEVIFRLKADTVKARRGKTAVKALAVLARFQASHPKKILLVVAALTLLIVPGFSKVYLDVDDENWLPENDPILEALMDVGTKFSGLDSQAYLVMLDSTYEPLKGEIPISDLRDPRVMEVLDRWAMAVEEIRNVDSVSTPTKDIKIFNDGVLPHDFEAIKTLVNENDGIGRYFNKDYSLIKVGVNAPANQQFYDFTYDEILAEIDTNRFPDGVKVVPQGGVAQDRELDESLGKDVMMTASLGFVFVITIAALFYQSLLAGMLAFIPILFAIIWTIGIMGWIGLPFTVLTSGMLAILMGIGIDFSIHIIHRTKEVLAEGKEIAGALVESLTGTGEAIFLSTLTTIVGFLALSLASLLATRRLGWTLAIGIGCTFVSCMLIVPATLAIQYKLRRRAK